MPAEVSIAYPDLDESITRRVDSSVIFGVDYHTLPDMEPRVLLFQCVEDDDEIEIVDCPGPDYEELAREREEQEGLTEDIQLYDMFLRESGNVQQLSFINGHSILFRKLVDAYRGDVYVVAKHIEPKTMQQPENDH